MLYSFSFVLCSFQLLKSVGLCVVVVLLCLYGEVVKSYEECVEIVNAAPKKKR